MRVITVSAGHGHSKPPHLLVEYIQSFTSLIVNLSSSKPSIYQHKFTILRVVPTIPAPKAPLTRPKSPQCQAPFHHPRLSRAWTPIPARTLKNGSPPSETLPVVIVLPTAHSAPSTSHAQMHCGPPSHHRTQPVAPPYAQRTPAQQLLIRSCW